MNTLESPSFALDSHEMRCLSVLKPMTFLMGAEFDLFLAATKARDAELAVQFPPLHPEYAKSLALCAARFQLTCEVDGVVLPATASASPNTAEPGAKDSAASAGSNKAGAKVVVKGVAKLPLLRYADFLPGLLHVDEILSVVGVRIMRTEPKPAAGQGANVFEAACIDYAPFRAEEPKFEAAAFYHTIDAGLPLATMAHLIRFEVAKIAAPVDAVKSFQRFSHWSKFDLRWDDDEAKRTGVVVMPSTADVHDIFDRYEDEATDDEATLLFRLRPVAPCAHVPYLEDALIRRLREQHWDDVKKAWATNARMNGVPTIVVSGLPSSPALNDLIAPFGKGHCVEASVVMEEGPAKRRKLYLTLDTAEAARAALALDGQRVAALPGKPIVRVQVAPPYLNASRRGHLLTSTRAARSPSPQSEPLKESATKKGKGAAKSAAKSPPAEPDAKSSPPASAKGKGPAGNAKSADGRKSRSPQQGPVSPPVAAAEPAKPAPRSSGKASPPAGPAAAKAAPKTSPGAKHADPKEPVEAMDRRESTDSTAAPMKREDTAVPADNAAGGRSPEEAVTSRKLNSSAAPFVPGRLSPNMSFTVPPPPYSTPAAGPSAAPVPPPPYTQSPAVGAAPPPYTQSPAAGAAPPPYSAAAASAPPPMYGSFGAPPPYTAPPAYAPPPAYSKTPAGGPAAAPPPPPGYNETMAREGSGMAATTGSGSKDDQAAGGSTSTQSPAPSN